MSIDFCFRDAQADVWMSERDDDRESGRAEERRSHRWDTENTSYVYMDTFCFHPNEFILIDESERSVYMNAK